MVHGTNSSTESDSVPISSNSPIDEQEMLQDTRSKRSRVSCRVHCKKCCRKEYHFLNIEGRTQRFITRILTLGLIGVVGQYRCVCCGTARMGRFDIIRGRDQGDADFAPNKLNPLNWWFERRDSWDSAKRKSRRSGSRKSSSRSKRDRRDGW